MPDALRLHLDADTFRKALHSALAKIGHDVTRTPCDWMELDADDAVQLRRSAARDRVIFTFNIRDFMILHGESPDHAGILLTTQTGWTLSELIGALDRFLLEVEPAEMARQVAWLNRWRG